MKRTGWYYRRQIRELQARQLELVNALRAVQNRLDQTERALAETTEELNKAYGVEA